MNKSIYINISSPSSLDNQIKEVTVINYIIEYNAMNLKDEKLVAKAALPSLNIKSIVWLVMRGFFPLNCYK